jgi:hypothetical protein
MKTYISTLFAAAIILVSASGYAADADKECLRGDAKTVDEAFKLGVDMAKKAGLELGDGENKAHIHILPNKEHNFYTVEVCSSACKKDNEENAGA